MLALVVYYNNTRSSLVAINRKELNRSRGLSRLVSPRVLGLCSSSDVDYTTRFPVQPPRVNVWTAVRPLSDGQSYDINHEVWGRDLQQSVAARRRPFGFYNTVTIRTDENENNDATKYSRRIHIIWARRINHKHLFWSSWSEARVLGAIHPSKNCCCGEM